MPAHRRLGEVAVRAAFCTLLVTLGTPSAPASAQGPSARDRASAAEAYDRGTTAYLADDFGNAARWFETAHRLAPAAAALVQAVRSHLRAGNTLRAATLALNGRGLYPDDSTAERTFARALTNAEQFVRVEVECDACSIELDGSIEEFTIFFVSPDDEHLVEAGFDTGARTERVHAAAGENVTLHFEAPEPDPNPDEATDPEETIERTETPEIVAPAPRSTPNDDPGLSVIPLPVTAVAAGLTVVAASILVWSGIDTLDGVPAYEANPTVEALADGQSREARTNWLIGVTTALGLTTVALAIFTDWTPLLGGVNEEDGAVRADVHASPDGAALQLRGRF